MNYFEILGIDESVTDDQVIADAYQQARIKWQTILNQGIGQQQQTARELMNGKLETAYETLSSPSRRQQYLREVKLSRETGAPVGEGRVKVSFSLSDGYADHEFLVVENPVRNPLVTDDGLSIQSFQEYICRAWEDPEMALHHVEDRTLERWMTYAAGEREIADAMRYFRWESEPTSTNSLLFMTLDLLQAQYPVPILPRSQPDMLDKLPAMRKPEWRLLPSVVNFGLLSGNAPRTIPLFVTTWQQKAGKMTASVNHPVMTVDSSKLDSEGRLDVSVNVEAMQRGETAVTTVTVISEHFGKQVVPVFAARPNRLQGNKELGQSINLQAGKAALERQSYHDAYRFFNLAQATAEAAEAEFQMLRKAYMRHDWFRVIQLARHYVDRYGRNRPEVQLWLVEALRMVGGSIFQLGEHRRSLEYLAALACESAYVPDRERLRKSWSSQPETQLELNLDNPKEDWVIVTEHYGLNWTHASGRADGSNYAGEVPLDLSARRIVWRTGQAVAVKAPLIAYEGVLVARGSDNRRIIGFDAASGAVLWQHTEGLLGQQPAAPVAGGGRVFVADPSGGLYGLNVLTGKPDWKVQLGDGRDIALAYEDDILYVGLGKRVLILDAENGEQLAGTPDMKSFFGRMDSNPVNILVSEDCCLFQKVGGTSASMVFLDITNGATLEFPLPFSRKGVGSLLGSMLGTSTNQSRWAASGEVVFMPYLVTQEVECRTKYRDSDGKTRDRVERESWEEVHFFVYHSRHDQMVAHVWQIVQGTGYLENDRCRVSTKGIQMADALAVTPTYVEITDDANTLYPPQPGKPLHRLIAAAFGRHVYYWICTDKIVKQVGYRLTDGPVQSIAFLGIYDMVTTPYSMATSFIGSLKDGDSTGFAFPDTMGAVIGSPAIYGDIIYVTTKTGEVVAIGR